jgi:hypothetical protein
MAMKFLKYGDEIFEIWHMAMKFLKYGDEIFEIWR